MSGGRYGVVMPDPPWWYADMPKRNGGIQYERLKLPEMIAVMDPVIASQASRDWCALPMWFTGPHLPTALALGSALGFEWVTMLGTWCKTGPHDPGQGRLLQPCGDDVDDFNSYPGSGRYSKHATEYLGLWRRGSLPPIADTTVRQVIHAPVRQHSRKPAEAYLRLERLWPGFARKEMFARVSRPNWSAHGNQVDKFASEGAA